jgi:hypothetical protein
MRLGQGFDTNRQPDIRITTNATEVAALLNGIPYRRAENALRASVRAASNVVLKEAKRIVPMDTGALKKALGVKVSAIPGGAYGRIGVVEDRRYTVRAGKKEGTVTVKRLKRAEVETTRLSKQKRPALYAHRIEDSQPFLRPSLESRRAAVNAVLIKRLREELAKPWPKTKTKGTRVWRTASA